MASVLAKGEIGSTQYTPEGLIMNATLTTGPALGFTASPALAANLQRVLADLIVLHLQGKQAHWNVVGHNFRDLHLQLDEIVDDAREASDTIAERMRALNAVPDGRADTVARTTSLPRFPDGEQNSAAVVELISARLRFAVATMRAVHDDVDAEDPSTTDLLHGIIDGFEKHAWLLSAQNRSV
jgi:starvation-inducible DNA-binding protein